MSAEETTAPNIAPNISSVGKRIVGGLIDVIFTLIFLVIFGSLFGQSEVTFQSGGSFSIQVFGFSSIAGTLLAFLLLGLLEFQFGKTPGKMLTGMTVVSTTGAPLSLQQTIIRNMLRIIDGLSLYIVGLIIMIVDNNSQRLGDLVAKTYVINPK